MKVQVTQDDIIKGVRGDSCFCPIARAVSRRFPGKKIKVEYNYVSVGHGKWYLMAKEGKDFVQNFDCFGPRFVKPIEFDMMESN